MKVTSSARQRRCYCAASKYPLLMKGKAVSVNPERDVMFFNILMLPYIWVFGSWKRQIRFRYDVFFCVYRTTKKYLNHAA